MVKKITIFLFVPARPPATFRELPPCICRRHLPTPPSHTRSLCHCTTSIFSDHTSHTISAAVHLAYPTHHILLYSGVSTYSCARQPHRPTPFIHPQPPPLHHTHLHRPHKPYDSATVHTRYASIYSSGILHQYPFVGIISIEISLSYPFLCTVFCLPSAARIIHAARVGYPQP